MNTALITKQKSATTAYLLWLCCIVGFCGIHRFYLDRPLSGVVYVLTFGLLGVGQLIDLLTIPSMVDRANTRAVMADYLADQRAALRGGRT